MLNIPNEYRNASLHPGRLEKLEYQTYDSFAYGQKGHELTKTAWVYVPYGYDESRPYNIFYLSHGGAGNEQTFMGTPGKPGERPDGPPGSIKNAVDHAIEDRLMEPVLIVLPTYNNTTGKESWDYSTSLRLTQQFHNELVGDLMPAVESKYSTYARNTTEEGFRASREHRGFGGFSMGSVNTWHTFEYCLDYFRYFVTASGDLTDDGRYMADVVKRAGYGAEDFFIWSATGTRDFDYHAFKRMIANMLRWGGDIFKAADNEKDGNLHFEEAPGMTHDYAAADIYMFNGIRLIGQTWMQRSKGEKV